MNLHSIFYPKSVAIIGASTKIGSVGNDVCRNLITQGYDGKIYPVNPKATEMYGLPCYTDINNIEENVDLAIFAIPAAFIPQALIEAGKKGVKGAIIISAGFKEAGEKGEGLEKEIQEIVQKYNIALIGPNCLGLINPEVSLNASFAPVMPQKGNIAFISQSGALCTSVLDYAKGLGIGFSKFVSIGNKACVGEVELLEYLHKDPETEVIMMYIEQFANGAKLLDTAKKITAGENSKPIIILKSGRTLAGAAASASHTGSLGSNDAFIDALFKKCGILRADSIEELFDYAIAFANNPLPKGNRIAIITNAGGPGVLTADEATVGGLQLAQISDMTKEELRKMLPPSANIHNPIDVLGDAKADRYVDALNTVLKDENVDGAIVILTPQSMTEINETAQTIIQAKNSYGKPVIASFMGLATVNSGVKLLQEAHVSTISFPEYAARSMGAMVAFAQKDLAPKKNNSINNVNKAKVNNIFTKAVANGKTYFPEAEAREIFEAYGFPLLKSVTVGSRKEAEVQSESFSQPLVMKIVSKDIVHKSDVGGVIVGVKPNDVGEAYDNMMKTVQTNVPTAKLDGILLMEMAPKGGIELILGAKKDEQLGVTMIMVGMGGIYVEVFKDIVFAPAPLLQHEAEDLIKQIKISKLFEGVRGMPPYDTEILVDCILRLSTLITDFPEIKELDINPLVLYQKGQGAYALDARISL